MAGRAINPYAVDDLTATNPCGQSHHGLHFPDANPELACHFIL